MKLLEIYLATCQQLSTGSFLRDLSPNFLPFDVKRCFHSLVICILKVVLPNQTFFC